MLLDVPRDTLLIPLDLLSAPYQLPHNFIVPSSEQLQLKSFRLLPDIHYVLDDRQGILTLTRTFADVDTLLIIYQHYPFPLYADYFHRELQAVTPADSSDTTLQAASREVRSQFIDEIDLYQSQLNKSGSIVRGIEIGSNQDLTINSGLNLQLSGKITPNVDILAALTDESTPIQPEGNTQTLREVDKVFVKIKSPYVGGTLGDFNLLYQNSLFGNLQRKLEGITMENNIKSTRQQLTFGTSRGTFHSNKFLAQEGNQGPYQLTGRNGEREIIALAGTERIYVDGLRQLRGENNDYIIDYGTAQITFTSNKLITSENRIEVDFEYTSAFQRYGRNLLGVSSTNSGNTLSRVTYDVRMFREWDDTSNLLEDDAPLTDEETAALASAGDDPLSASVSGVTMDSVNGSYIQQFDSLQADQPLAYFEYVGPGLGQFTVRFAGVGVGNGDYNRVRLGVYEYIGPGRGQYLPIRLIPLAGDKRFADVGLGLHITDTWRINGEIGSSEFDRNIFSGEGDNDNTGTALQFSSELIDTSLTVAGKRLGAVQLSSSWRQQSDTFDPLDRPLQPEFNYKWSIADSNTTNEEKSFETSGAWQPVRFLRLRGDYGTLRTGFGIRSDRVSGGVEIMRTRLPDLSFNQELVESETRFDQNRWTRRKASARKTVGRYSPFYNFTREDRKVERITTGRTSGFKFDNNHVGLSAKELLGVDWKASFQYRTDFLYNPAASGDLLDQATSQTYEFAAALPQARNLRGSLSFAFRDKNYTDFFEQLPADSMAFYQADAQFQDTSWQDRQSHLANLELQYRNDSGSLSARFDYKVASELQALREKVYIEVTGNQGSFRFDSTLNEYVPDPIGDYILILLQTGNFESVTNLETAFQLNYRPVTSKSKFQHQSPLQQALSKISSLSYVKIDEQSRLPNIWDIYLLNIDSFHKSATSLRSSFIINQDLQYNERHPIWGVLLRSRYRDNLSNQFLDVFNNETKIVWDRLLEVRHRFFRKKLNVTLGYGNSLNKRWVAASTLRNQNILGQSLSTQLNFTPNFRWQLELDIERSFERDRNPNSAIQLNFWDIRPQLAYSIRGKARATTNLTYINVNEVANPFNRPIPFDMGQGKKIGDSWQWNLRFEYFISSNVTINANYNGRKDAEAVRTIHLGKAEVRAFF